MISVRSTNTAKAWLSSFNRALVDMKGPVVKGVYRGLYLISDEIKRKFVSGTSIGRKVWGPAEARGKKSNLGTFIRPMQVSGGGGGFRGGIEMRGIPALVEMGGRTKPHAIFPKGARSVASRKLSPAELARWTIRSGRNTRVGGGVLRMADGSFVRWVKAHSARVPAHHFAAAVISRNQALIAEAIERRLSREMETAA